MRANARRAASNKKNDPSIEQPRSETPAKEDASDKLDFSSEFTSQDMGLASQSQACHLKWKRSIEDDEHDEENQDKDEEDHAQEWSGGEWQQKQDEESTSSPESDESDELEEQREPDPLSLKEPPNSGTPSTLDDPDPRPLEPSPTPAPSHSPLKRSPHPSSPPEHPKSSPDAAAPDSFAPAPRADTSPKDSILGSPTLERAPAPLTPVLRLRPSSRQELQPSGQADDLDPELIEAASRLILSSHEDPGFQECVRLLARFGLGALRLCARSSVKVEIHDDRTLIFHPALVALNLSEQDAPSDGAYLVSERLVLIDRSCLLAKPRFFHPTLYYFAHAFDHAQGGDTFASKKAAAIVACFESSVRGLGGFDFVDELAAADPVRYFARSVAVYLGRDDCDDPLWSHQDLYDFDRPMYDYLQYLFSRLST